MLQAYFDESGIQAGSSYFVLAGFVGGARKWVQLEGLWTKHLANAGVQDFHAKDFVKLTGEFYGWSEEQRVDLCRRLVAAFKPQGFVPVGGVVPVPEFLDRAEWERRILTGGIAKARDTWVQSGKPSAPYFMAYPFVLMFALQQALDGPEHIKVDFFFDSQQEYEGLAQKFFEDLQMGEDGFAERMGRLVYTSRRDTPALGVADLFAHLVYLEAVGTLEDTHPINQWAYEQLRLKESEGELVLFDDPSMNNVAAVLGRSSLRCLS